MAECVKNAFDFIKSAFPLKVGVLCSQDVDILSQKNNLSFCELIQPFCALSNETNVQGIGNQISRAFNIHLKITDISQNEQSNTNETAVKHLINDLVQGSLPNENSVGQTVRFDTRGYDLEVNKSCAWFDVYRDMSIRYGKLQDHEFLNHYVACMLVVSSSHPNPLDEFVKLSHQQNQIQHILREPSSIKWMSPNTLKYYVLLHDVTQGNTEKAKSVFSDLQALYGMKVCYLLEINSKGKLGTDSESNLPDPWTKHMSFTVSNGESSPPAEETVNVVQNGSDNAWLTELEKVSVKDSKLGFGCSLTLADHDKLRIFMQQFFAQGLAPNLAKTLKSLHEQVNSRKTIHKSFFRATRTLFGSKSTSALSNISASYSQDANELNIRKLGDICFLLQLYDQAFQYYHTARKDYTNDQAWLFAAGACEMAALSNFMQTNVQKSYPVHYMENAYNIYSDMCKNDFLSLRCTLLHTACLQTKGLFSEAAFYFVKMTDEADDLRSGLLLEQAAHCYLKMKLPYPRKFAFHMILAGHRFSKCLQRQHSLRCYSHALQIHEDRGWYLAENNINFIVARQCFNLRQIQSAVTSFRKLLTQKSYQPTIQQAAVFEEFIHVFKQYLQEKSPGDVDCHAGLSLPQVIHSDLKTIIIPDNQVDHTHKSTDGALTLANMSLRNVVKSEEIPPLLNIGNCFCGKSNNQNNPVVAVNEPFTVCVSMKNVQSISLIITKVSLIWKCDDPNTAIDDIIQCNEVSCCKFEPTATTQISFIVTPLQAGMITATGIKYNMGIGNSVDNLISEETFYSVVDQQQFNIKGPRLNSNKNERCEVYYGLDNRLNISVEKNYPNLKVQFNQFSDMLVDEVCETTMTIQNIGERDIIGIRLLTDGDINFVVKSNDNDEHALINGQASLSSPKNLLHNALKKNESLTFTIWAKTSVPGEYNKCLLLHYYSSLSDREVKLQRFFYINILFKVTQKLSGNKNVLNMNSNGSHLVSVSLKSEEEHDLNFVVKNIITCNNNWTLTQVSDSTNTSVIEPSQSFTTYMQMTKGHRKTIDSSTQLLPPHCHYLYKTSTDYPTVLVLWETQNNSRSRTGITEMLFEELCNAAIKTSDSQENDETSNTTENAVVHWSLIYDTAIKHNFINSALCYTPVHLKVYNITSDELAVRLQLEKPSSIPMTTSSKSGSLFSWLGHTATNFSIKPLESKTLILTACFKNAGVYNINSINLTAANNSNVEFLKQNQSSDYFITINNSSV